MFNNCRGYFFRGFWIVMLCLSTVGCTQEMYRLWRKIESNRLSFGRISFKWNINANVSIFVRPEYIATPDDLELHIVPYIRQCYFSGERQLEYFRHYTLDNCVVEYLTNITLDRCNCVAFYIPIISSYVPIRSASNQCFQNVTKSMVENGIEMTVCNYCLSPCTELIYKLTVDDSHTPYPLYGIGGSNISGSVNDVFLEPYFKTKETKYLEIFGKPEFIPSRGDALILLLGFSVITLVEVIHFMYVYISTKRKMLSAEESSMVSIDSNHYSNHIVIQYSHNSSRNSII